VGKGVGVLVGLGVSVGSGVAVSVGMAGFVGVCGGEVMLGTRVATCGVDTVSDVLRGVPPDRRRQEIIVNVKARAEISKIFEFIALL
jgi:hypothetical protein